MKRVIFGCALVILSCFCLFAYAEDSDFVEDPANHGERIVGDKKYFGMNHTGHTYARDYIVKNPRTTKPKPGPIPLVKTDSTHQECFGWTEDQRASNWIYPPAQPRVAVVGDTIHIVWKQQFYSKFTHSEVCYVRSADGGLSWSDSILLSVTDGVESIRPEIVAKHDNVYVVWEDWTSMDWGGIYFRKSTDGGTTWQEITPVALRGVDDYAYYCPTIAVRDSEIYVAYNRNDGLEGSLRFKKSLDAGDSWESEVIVSDTPETGHWLKLSMNPAGLHISHEAGLRIYYNRSTDWGDTWSDDVFISDMENSAAQWPSIGADENGGVYITWFDYKYSPYPWTGDIFLRRSTDNGVSWDSIMVLTDNHLCDESDICADESSVLTVWRDERYGDPDFEIYGRRSNDLGTSWQPEQNLSNAPYQSYNPRVIAYSDWVHMVWVDARDMHGDAFYKRGTWYLRGDTNRDRIINVIDIVYLINYLFIGGPSPLIFDSGDVNDDNQVNVVDIVYLINYLFGGGPPPAEC
ncbi:MAG: hypothetical protein KAW52_05105 [candidate division Zixibacteria bacterium]|nr:hypothetical protein [candidate division Zixibacteria bacterium]